MSFLVLRGHAALQVSALEEAAYTKVPSATACTIPTFSRLGPVKLFTKSMKLE